MPDTGTLTLPARILAAVRHYRRAYRVSPSFGEVAYFADAPFDIVKDEIKTMLLRGELTGDKWNLSVPKDAEAVRG